ncbi:MAG: PD40 domain-containing protein [Flavobacteriales bacterium]|nr:PD40 domain-containing protein [Flavobacteriales bacterium]
MANKCRRISMLVLFWVLAHTATAQFYHGMHHPFGKNRVQHEHFEWVKYEFNHFTVFFYGESKNLALFTARNANQMIDDVEQFFDYSIRKERVQIVVYQKLEHFRQSNVGIPETDESNIGGTTQIAGSKIFVYFDGDLNSFREQIRLGLSQVLVGQMLFGDNWREMIKNSALINFPLWFTSGLTNYAAKPWDVDADDQLRDLVSRDQFGKFNRLRGADSELAGRALWYYIGETYGTNVIPNILYMARVTRNVESGFLFVLGISLNTLLNDADRYFQYRYSKDEEGTQEFNEFLPIKTKKAVDYTEPRLSPDGRYLAYVSNDLSKTKLMLYDTQKNQRQKLMRQGHRLDHMYDLGYPVMDWNPATGELFVITEKGGKLWMYRFDAEKGKKIARIELLRLEKVLEMDFAPNGKEILFSAINGGETDIYLYSIAANSQQRLTDDIYDDRYPVFWMDGSILFASNRESDIINEAKDYLTAAPALTMDLYKLDLDGDAVAMRLTNTPMANEIMPAKLDNDEYMFLGDASGIQNRYLGMYDSSIVSIDTVITYRYFSRNEALTGYKRNLKEFDLNRSEKKIVEMFFDDGRYHFMELEGNDIRSVNDPVRSNYAQNRFVEAAGSVDDTLSKEVMSRSDSLGIKVEKRKVFPDDLPHDFEEDGLIDIFNYQFEDDLIAEDGTVVKEKEGEVQAPELVDSVQAPAKPTMRIPEMRNYDIAFAATALTTQFDFDYATDLYQPFTGGPYVMPGMGTFLKVGMLDVFEDYKIEGGFRYSFNNNGTEYFISLEDRSKRLDKKYIVQRQALTTLTSTQITQRTQLYQGRGIFRYPLDEVNAFQATVTGRYDRVITLGADLQSLGMSDITEYFAGVKLEYIFDNTLNKSLNILNGTRLKVFGEHYRSVKDPSASMFVTGLDLRNYLPIHRDLIWANRLAGSSSFGTQKLVYYMGSVDNWVVLGNRERFDYSTNISQTQGYRFQSIATNMRGFVQNARNGNNFAVFNSELRWPVVRYFTNKPLKSEFLSTLQIIGFADVGTAWTGATPYSEENTFNRIEESNGSITVIYENQSDPLIGGVGMGLRAKIWGYFVRFDHAWGIENGLFLESMVHLSLGLDF